MEKRNNTELTKVKVKKNKDGNYIFQKFFKQESELRWNELINEYMALENNKRQMEDSIKRPVKDILKELEEGIPDQKKMMEAGLKELKMMEKELKPHYEDAKKTLEKKSGGKAVNGKRANEYFG